MDIPSYQYVPEDHIPTYTSIDADVSTKVITGKQKDIQGPITSVSEVLVLWASAQNKGTETYKIPEGYNCMLYVIFGNISISGYGLVAEKSLAIFEDTGNTITISASTDTSFLILAGPPINEKMAQQGPFVMNSETELLEAMRDYQMGKMGVLIEE